ncbi:MAG: penicillin acylase family protein, partial [Candidatus Thorarchaeota archaeon]|nr:penicillin acylase family protein [Candidatus Thorarchaeota archaeon]
MKKRILKLILSLIGPIALIILLSMPIGPLAGGLGILQPIGGIYDVGVGIQDSADRTVSIPGLEDEVAILIDEWGIPHIYGESVFDAFVGLGYMHAKDRLFQMVMQTYLAAGRISEVVGGYAASSDKMHRALGLRKSAVETYQWYLDNAATNEDVAFTLEAVNGHVAGINAYIASMTSATTPIEFKILGYTPGPWEPVNTFIWAKYMSWGLSGGFTDLLRLEMRLQLDNDTMYNELLPEQWPYTVPIVQEQYNLSIAEYPDAPGGYPAAISLDNPVDEEEIEDLVPVPEIDEFLDAVSNVVNLLGDRNVVGSNSWAATGSKTENGQAILANDPHLTLQAPSLWYEAQIVVPGELNVQGGTLPGTPGVLIGHTEHMAWGMTNCGSDFVDLFVEEINSEDPSQYRYGDEWLDFEVVDESILTKEGEIIPFNVNWTVHGPCVDAAISGTMGLANLAMYWTGNGITHEVLALGLLNRANNLNDYYDAMYWWDSPPHNFIYADDEGNIAVTVAGRFPMREGYSGKYPVSGANDSIGVFANIPYAYNPRSVNPSSDYIQTANQASIDPNEYSFTVPGPQAMGYRARRIDSFLKVAANLDSADMMRFQADVFDIAAQQIVPFALGAWEAEGETNASVQNMVDILSEWNYQAEADKIGPTIWIYLLDAIKYETFDEIRSADISLGRAYTPVLENLLREEKPYYFDDHTTNSVIETMNETLASAFYRAYNELVDDYGVNVTDWTYGNHHVIYIDHLAELTFIGGGPHRGDGYTLNVAGGWKVDFGPSRRMVADFDETLTIYAVYPGGQSQVMFSPHWDDLFQLWYTYNEVTKTYGYTVEHFYATAAAFIAADTSS